MKKVVLFATYLVALSFYIINLNAEEASTSNKFFTPPEVGLQYSTLGVGINVSSHIISNLSLRLNVNQASDPGLFGIFDFPGNVAQGAVDAFSGSHYKYSYNYFTAGLLADYQPFDNSGFRLTGGAYYNDQYIKLKLSGYKHPTDQVVIGNDVFNFSDIKSAHGRIYYNNFSPYLGVGYSSGVNKTKGFAFTADLGILFLLDQKTKYDAYCNDPTNTSICARLSAASEVERSALKKDSKYLGWEYSLRTTSVTFFPTISVGIAYKF